MEVRLDKKQRYVAPQIAIIDLDSDDLLLLQASVTVKKNEEADDSEIYSMEPSSPVAFGSDEE